MAAAMPSLTYACMVEADSGASARAFLGVGAGGGVASRSRRRFCALALILSICARSSAVNSSAESSSTISGFSSANREQNCVVRRASPYVRGRTLAAGARAAFVRAVDRVSSQHSPLAMSRAVSLGTTHLFSICVALFAVQHFSTGVARVLLGTRAPSPRCLQMLIALVVQRPFWNGATETGY